MYQIYQNAIDYFKRGRGLDIEKVTKEEFESRFAGGFVEFKIENDRNKILRIVDKGTSSSEIKKTTKYVLLIKRDKQDAKMFPKYIMGKNSSTGKYEKQGENFNAIMFTIPVDHILNEYEYELVDGDEKEEVKRFYESDITHFPKRKDNDRICMFHDFNAGQFVKCKNLESIAEFNYYYIIPSN